MRACKYNVKGGVLALLLVLCCFSQNTAQQIWIVSNEPGYATADFDNVQEAIDSASAGDKIYVLGSVTDYEIFLVDKRLHLVGSGYWKSENGIQTQNLLPTKIYGHSSVASISIVADSCIVEGFQAGNISIQGDNVIVRHNRTCCKGGSFTPSGQIHFIGNPTNVSVYRNFVNNGFNGSATGANIFNNIVAFGQDNYPDYWSSNNLNSNCLVIQNSFGLELPGGEVQPGHGVIDNCIFRNNIVSDTLFEIDNSVVEHNIFSDDDVEINGIPTDSLGNGNIDSVDINIVWDFSNPSPDGKYQLIGDPISNPAFGAGMNGEDCGAFGASAPYILSGIVQIPSITQMYIPPIGDTTNMLNIKIKAKSN